MIEAGRPLKVAAFTGNNRQPSSRFRVRQYIRPLKNENVEMTDFSCRSGVYAPENKYLRPIWGVANLAEHFVAAVRSHRYDVTLLNREFLATYYTLEWLTKAPRVFDIDDAIYTHRRGGGFVDKLLQISSAVICGHEYLAEYCRRINHNVYIVPTSVDVKRFIPSVKTATSGKIIGWSGQQNGLQYVYAIEDGLKKVLAANKNAKLRIVCDKAPKFRSIPDEQLEYFKWTANDEVQLLQQMDIGLMPLTDNEFSRGKCSFKMLTYMACGVPVVVSPVGMNLEVMCDGEAGFFANTDLDWYDRITTLLKDDKLSAVCGVRGREIVEQRFSVQINAKKIAAILRSVSNNH
ncbi:MAG: glycosyltransferase [Negativicutes bacterium]|jgi:glycosyltransferase involved in cell wall biosynthesis